MALNKYFAERISKLFFLEVKKEAISSLVDIDENLYMPIKSEDIINKIKLGEEVKNLTIDLFIEGMVLVLGADEEFKLNEIYKKIIRNTPSGIKMVKRKIFNNIECGNIEDSYLMLKGLLNFDCSEEVIDKCFIALEYLRSENKEFEEEELNLIEYCKKEEVYNKAYFYEALICRDKGNFEDALYALNTYISKEKEHEISKEILELKISFKNIVDMDRGKELVHENPKEALALLLPLVEQFSEEPSLYYYIAIAYRELQLYEKSIYYLNEALSLDKDFVDVVNELGINYAYLNDFETAINYFKMAFRTTKDISICTNIIMCYLNINDMENAKLHLDIAKKINSQDEVLKSIEKKFFTKAN